MRNIKTMLRNSRNSALLFAAASGLLYLTACSSEVNYDGGQDVPDTPATKAPFSVFSGNQSRVINYGKSATRAASDFEMPAQPTIPTDAKDLNFTDEWGGKPNLNYGTPAAEGIYFVKAGESLKSGLKMTGITVYVAGTLELEWLNASNANTVYVLEGGKILFPAAINPGITVYNWGDVACVSGGVTIGNGAAIYSAVDIDCGDFEFGINSGDNAGKLFSKGSIIAKNVRLNGEAVACGFIADEEIVFNENGTFKTSYIKAPTVSMNAGNIVLDNNGLIDAGTLNLTNADTRITVDGTNAVAAAGVFNTNNVQWPKVQFANEIALDFKECTIDGKAAKFEDFEFQVSDENQVIYVPAAGCHEEYGQKPTDPTTTEIVKVVDIESLDEEINHGNHDHGIISATCINFGPDGTAYASYHLRGKGSKGCIEVINDNGSNGLSLGSYMITDSIDYNHIIIDGDYIYVVGNNTYDKYNDGTFKGGKGAIVGKINKNFTASENKTDELDIKELTTDEVVYIENASGDKIRGGYKNAGDGNTIVKHGNQYLVTTYRGYGIINPDLSKVPGTFVNTTGSCKHIALNSDGSKAAILSLDTYNEKSSTASLKTFTLGSGESTFASVLASYDQIGTVEPVDGKNVVAFDGEDIYACLSKGGLARIRNGVVEQTRTFGSGNMPVNGLAIDENYLYVATGSFVYVLEKESMKSICHYRAENEKSANYIALRNGKIYVAYGENGIMAFQLVEKEISK